MTSKLSPQRRHQGLQVDQEDQEVLGGWQYWAYMVREGREILEVQVVLEDLDDHRNQSLVALVAPEVQEGPLWDLPLDPAGPVCQEALVGPVLLQNVGHNIHHQALPFLPSHLNLHALPSVHS